MVKQKDGWRQRIVEQVRPGAMAPATHQEREIVDRSNAGSQNQMREKR